MPRPIMKPSTARLEPAEHLTKLYNALHQSINSNSFATALKQSEKILQINSQDSLAFQTKIQVLILLERFAEALLLLDGHDGLELQQAYCLYKSGRSQKAQEIIASVTDNRGAVLLQAQIDYRLEDYVKANSIYEELISTADTTSPELEDLETNSATCSTHLEFLAAIPSTLTGTPLPSIQTLESTPLSSLIQSHPSLKPTISQIPSRSLKPVAEAPLVPGLDPDRWLPKRERAGYTDEVIRKRERERGRRKNKARENLLIQGASDSVPMSSTVPGSSTGKKKKGKK